MQGFQSLDLAPTANLPMYWFLVPVHNDNTGYWAIVAIESVTCDDARVEALRAAFRELGWRKVSTFAPHTLHRSCTAEIGSHQAGTEETLEYSLTQIGHRVVPAIEVAA